MSTLEDDDIFPLWTFSYQTMPEFDDPSKIFTTRGRTPREALHYLVNIEKIFKEPEKVGLHGNVSIKNKEEYSKTHPYDWLCDAPLWLKLASGRKDLIW